MISFPDDGILDEEPARQFDLDLTKDNFMKIGDHVIYFSNDNIKSDILMLLTNLYIFCIVTFIT